MRVIELTLTGSAQQVTTGKIYSPSVTFANNDATNAVTIGDNTVTATKGIVIPKATTFTITSSDNRIPVFQFYAIGTAASKLEILYV